MSAALLRPELACVWLAIASLAGAGASAALGARRAERTTLVLLCAALLALAAGIGLRWARLGHGPFMSLFEILASSLFSLGLACALVWWRKPMLRRSAVIVIPLLLVVAAWLAVANPADTQLPPTYETSVLWFHVLFGKVFLAFALVATGIAGVVLVRRGAAQRWFAGMPCDRALDAFAWRCMLAALVFETLMLIAGAVWAQDAWGRYWAWDPLETWSFVTWLALAGAVHARLAYRVGPRTGAVLIVAVFALAFLTFFGVPFVSTAPHKGAI